LEAILFCGGLLTQVDLLGVAVGLEGLCDTQNSLIANGKLCSWSAGRRIWNCTYILRAR
jgi:hypothetical protein